MRVDVVSCDMCGKEFNEFDRQEDFGFYYPNIGYGSKFDGTHISIDLCCDCFDKMIEEYVIPKLQGVSENYIKDATP